METIKIKKYPDFNRIYQHYKGGTYVPLFLAKHTENQEELVIYKSREFGTVYARPLNEWNEEVTYMRENASESVTHSRFSIYNGC